MSFLHGLQRDNDDDSVIFVPYKKPKPPEIVLDDEPDDHENWQDPAAIQDYPLRLSQATSEPKPAKTRRIKKKSKGSATTPKSLGTAKPSTSEGKARKRKKKKKAVVPQALSESSRGEPMVVPKYKDLVSEPEVKRPKKRKRQSRINLLQVAVKNDEKRKKYLLKRRQQRNAKDMNLRKQQRLSKKMNKKQLAEIRAKKKVLRERKLQNKLRRLEEQKQVEQESVDMASVVFEDVDLERPSSKKKMKLAQYRANMELIKKTRRENKKERQGTQRKGKYVEAAGVVAKKTKTTNVSCTMTKEIPEPEDENLETQSSKKKSKLAEYRSNMKLLKKTRRELNKKRIECKRLKQKIAEASGITETEEPANPKSVPLTVVENQLVPVIHSNAENDLQNGNKNDGNTGLKSGTPSFITIPRTEGLSKPSWTWKDGNGNQVLLRDADQRLDLQQSGKSWTMAIPLHLPPPGYPAHHEMQKGSEPWPMSPPTQNWFIATIYDGVNPVYMSTFANTFVQQPYPHQVTSNHQQSYVSSSSPQQLNQMEPGHVNLSAAVKNEDSSEDPNGTWAYTRRPRKPTP